MSKTLQFALCLTVITIVGALTRSYGITAPWKTKDHYNYGGPANAANVFCIRESPWEITGGRTHVGCPEEVDRLSPLVSELPNAIREKLFDPHRSPPPSRPTTRSYYLNHPPFQLWMLAGLTSLLGESEWVFRTMTLVFSILNILLVAWVARRALLTRSQALFAAFCQASFLGGMYFGTHVDYPSEINATFILVASGFALSGSWMFALIAAALSGMMDWPGFMMFAALFAVACITKQKRLFVFLGGICGLCLLLLTAGYMVGWLDGLQHILHEMMHNHYVKPATSVCAKLFRPLEYLRVVFVSHSRLLGPVFFALALMAIARGIQCLRVEGSAAIWRRVQREKALQALVLTGLPMLITMLAGPSYVMVHVFWFMMGLPFWALLITLFVGPLSERAREGMRDIANAFKSRKKLAVFFLLLAGALFPYGIFQSSVALDVSASVFVISSVLLAIALTLRNRSGFHWGVCMLLFAVTGNFLETVNYRTEPPVDHDFCLHAFENYIQTNTGVDLGPAPSLARVYYCRGIPQISR